MKTRKHLVDAYQDAMRAEADLWERVKDRGPGQPGYDQVVWTQWLEAVGRTTAAARALREAFREPQED